VRTSVQHRCQTIHLFVEKLNEGGAFLRRFGSDKGRDCAKVNQRKKNMGGESDDGKFNFVNETSPDLRTNDRDVYWMRKGLEELIY